MFLSNPAKYFLLAIICVVFNGACSSAPSNTNTAISLSGERGGEFPFSTIEPDVYQGQVYITVDGKEAEHWFVAKNHAKWRADFFENGQPARTQIRNGGLFTIDEQRKTYSVSSPTGDGLPERGFGNPLNGLFSGKQYHDFVEVGREGQMVRYKVTGPADSKGEAFISIDQPSGLIVRQEFTNGTVSFLYEIRDLRLEVDESLFQMPQGYEKSGADENQPKPGKK